MNRDDIIKLAREAGASFETAESMFRFAALVAAHEREQCAKLTPNGMSVLASDPPPVVWEKYRQAIRARPE